MHRKAHNRTAWIAATFVLAISGMVLPAQASNQPDLVVASLSGRPAFAQRGIGFPLGAKVKNLGTAQAPTTSVTFVLSLNRTFGGTDRRVGGVWLGGLGAGASKTAVVWATVPIDMALGNFYLVACVDRGHLVAESTESNNCRATMTTVMIKRRSAISCTACSTYERIDAAQTAGVFPAETALVYKLFRDFGDPRLPTRLVGIDPPGEPQGVDPAKMSFN